MKRSFLVIPLMLCSLTFSFAQDRIVTINNDTIFCKIVRKGSHSITFLQNTGPVQTTGKIDRLEVKELITTETTGRLSDSGIPSQRFRLSLTSGLSFLVASTEDAKATAMAQGWTQQQADSYYRKLKFGWSGSAGLHYILDSGIGLGLNYRFFASGADEWVTIDPQDGVNLYFGQMKENMDVNYIGPSLLTIQSSGYGDKLRITSAVSAGLMLYRNEASVIQNNLLLTGKAFGASLDSGLEYFFMKNIALGIHLGLFASKLKKATVDDGTTRTTIDLPKEQYENVSAIDLSAGLKIYLNK